MIGPPAPCRTCPTLLRPPRRSFGLRAVPGVPAADEGAGPVLGNNLQRPPHRALPVARPARVGYGNFDIGFAHFSRRSQLYATARASCDVPYLVPQLFSATNWCLQSDLMTDSPSGLPPVMTHPCMHPSGCDNLITSECPSILGTGPPANEPCWVRGHPVCTSHAPLTWPLIRRSLRSDHHLAHRCLARAGNQSRIMNIGRCYCPDSV